MTGHNHKLVYCELKDGSLNSWGMPYYLKDYEWVDVPGRHFQGLMATRIDEDELEGLELPENVLVSDSFNHVTKLTLIYHEGEEHMVVYYQNNPGEAIQKFIF